MDLETKSWVWQLKVLRQISQKDIINTETELQKSAWSPLVFAAYWNPSVNIGLSDETFLSAGIFFIVEISFGSFHYLLFPH